MFCDGYWARALDDYLQSVGTDWLERERESFCDSVYGTLIRVDVVPISFSITVRAWNLYFNQCYENFVTRAISKGLQSFIRDTRKSVSPEARSQSTSLRNF